MPGTVRYRILPDIASCRPGQLACWLELAELCRAFEIDVKLPRAARSGLNHRDPGAGSLFADTLEIRRCCGRLHRRRATRWPALSAAVAALCGRRHRDRKGTPWHQLPARRF